ncbi:NAD(P)H-binding protein [Candidatus Neomarinimicrobiota bacterium]
MKVAVFGGTGFVGSYILKELSNNSFSINALVRKDSENKIPKVNNINVINGDLSDIDSVKETIKHCDIVIYAVGIIREYSKRGITFEKLHYEYFKNIVDISKSAVIKKVIYISANGAKPIGTKYQTSKYLAEQYLQNNFNNWTIFRPSVVFGDPEGKMEFVSQLKKDIVNKYFPVPLFFRSNPFKYNIFFKSNPVHVGDLAKLVVKGLQSDNANNVIFTVGGLQETTWHSMLKTISNTTNRKKIFLLVPIIIVQIFAKMLDRFRFFPITYDQLKMLKEDNICASEDIFREFDIKPKEFSTDNLDYLQN